MPRAGRALAAGAPHFESGRMGQNSCMILDWTNWTFWVTTLALVAFGFCLGVLYEQWYFRKVRNEVRDEVRRGSRSDAASSNRNGALKQGKCRHCFEVSLAVEAERIAANIAKLPDGCAGRPTAGPPRAASRRLGSSRSTTTRASS